MTLSSASLCSAVSDHCTAGHGSSPLLLGWPWLLRPFGPFPRALPLHSHCRMGPFTISSIGRDLSTHVTAGLQLQELMSGPPAPLSALILVLRLALPLQAWLCLLTCLPVLLKVGHDEQVRESAVNQPSGW